MHVKYYFVSALYSSWNWISELEVSMKKKSTQNFSMSVTLLDSLVRALKTTASKARREKSRRFPTISSGRHLEPLLGRLWRERPLLVEQPSSGGAVKALVPSDRPEHVDRIDVHSLLLSERLCISVALSCLSLPPSEHLGDAHPQRVLGHLAPRPPLLHLLLRRSALALAPVLLLDPAQERLDLGGEHRRWQRGSRLFRILGG